MEKNKKLVIGNFKMNFDLLQLNDYLKSLNGYNLNDNVIICPTSIYIPYFLKKKYKVGIQNVFMHEFGEYTGEVSPKQAASMGVNYVILGHSERRLYFDESDSMINNKVIGALKCGLKVILCVGETLEERNMLRTDKILKRQLTNCLRDIPEKRFKDVIIVYEPRWAIGSDLVPSNKDIIAAVSYIRDVVNTIYLKAKVKVLYGGSVNDKNIKEINKVEEIDGVLVGRSSLDVEKFMKIIEVVVNQ